MDLGLKGKKAFVTGASKGIGFRCERAAHLPAVVHADGTGRLQIVRDVFGARRDQDGGMRRAG